MFFLDDVWHVVVRIVGVLVLNPPSLPAWATWFLLIIRTLVVVVLFRRNIAPFLLAKVSRRIRARSISPRSIRGLYFRSHGRTWKVERIGWSFHPWAESRVSVKIEGLHVNIDESRSVGRKQKNFQAFPTRDKVAFLAAIRDAVTLSLERLSIFHWINVKVSAISLMVARLFVRCLPSLTQNVDFELDSAVVSFAALAGAHILIRGVTLCTKIEFSQLEKEFGSSDGGTKRRGSQTGRDKPPSWKLFVNPDQWDHLWGQTQAFASVDITINELAVYNRPASPILQNSRSAVGSSHPSFDVYSISGRLLPSDTIVHVVAPLHFVASLEFTPKLLTIRRKSVDCLLELPTINISANAVHLLEDWRNSQKHRDVDTVQHSAFFNSSKSRSPPATPVENIPVHENPGSPTSPILTAFSQITRHVKGASVSFLPPPPVHRMKDLSDAGFVSLVRSIRFQLSSIKLTYDLPVNLDGHTQSTYVARIDGLGMEVCSSDPERHVLHRKWLGSRHYSALDGAALSISCQSNLVTLQRVPPGAQERPVRLLALNGLDIVILVNNWPQPWLTAPRLFPGDPNSPFMACEVTVLTFELFDRLDDLRASLATIPVRRAPTRRPSVPTMLACVPRIDFRATCGAIQGRILCTDKGVANNTLTLEVKTTGFELGLSTAYGIMNTTGRRGIAQTLDSYDLQMNSASHVVLRPLEVRVGRTRELDTELFDDDPLLRLDTMEFTTLGHTLCHSGNEETAVLHPYTTMIDILCITDGVSVDLWKSECVRILCTILDAFNARKVRAKDVSPSGLLEGLYSGLSIHFAVGCFTSIVTAKDVNPACDLELSRGLALHTGFSLQYSCMQASRHSYRVKNRFSSAQARQNLGLSEDLLIQSMAIANAEAEPDDISALVQSTTWSTVCRTAISTRYATDDDDGVDHNNAEEETLREGALIRIPRTITKIRLRHRKIVSSTLEAKFEDSCNIFADLPYFTSRFDLFNAYSALLALHTLQSLARHANPHPYPQKSWSALNLIISLRLRVENAHIFCQFPLRERMFVRVLSSSLQWSHAGIAKADCKSVVAWVPSLQSRGRWEELSRFRDLSVTLIGRPEVHISVAADGFRIVIPHQYALSELVLNVVLTIKALRHLHRTVESEQYTAMDCPAAESPKHLPNVDVRIHSLTLEAADSPFEAKLGLIWRTGFQAQKVRIERELAFEAKLRAILASGDHGASGDTTSQSGLHYHFTSKRTTSVSDARDRLNMIHSNSWLTTISRQKEDIARKEESILRQLRHATHKVSLHVPVPIQIHNAEKVPPLLRAVVSELVLSISRPDLPEGCKDFLNELGNIPYSTEYSLLLPLRLELGLNATRINIRDYRLPLLNVPFKADGPSLEFMTNLVIAEEMGNADSVEWFQCQVFDENTGIVGANAFRIRVPKTIMPVKSYASPYVYFRTPEVTDFTWGVSYNPAIQEVMRVIETLSHPPRDPSPAIGFWDKLRLVFHWRIDANFRGGARLHFKGSRDPYHIIGIGAGFDFCWDGNVAIKVGYSNEENELIQLTSDTMLVTIPNHKYVQDGSAIGNLSEPPSVQQTKKGLPASDHENRNDRKVCAKFSNGIRLGVGITLERTCGTECDKCHGDDFSRECRFFTFVPHHQVVLHAVDSNPNMNNRDSYAGFRSNFIHFSTSLTSPLTRDGHSKLNSFHLTPRTFAHFWSWWHLFDGALSLPIRQGRLFPDSRPPSKKFGRHLATLKYRISFSPLYITHVYKIDSGDAWSAGESRCVGVKAFIKHFQADMHQREEETSKPTKHGDGYKIIRHRPFSAVEVVITGLDLRALFAVFSEPQKKTIPLKDSLPGTANFWESLFPTPLSSSWVDPDDFVELDWSPTDQEPNLYLLEAASCPRLVYFKRTAKPDFSDSVKSAIQPKLKTKFGDESSHLCLMGKEPTAQDVQLEFGAVRLAELRARMADSMRTNSTGSAEHSFHESGKGSSPDATRETSLTQMIALLERYTHHLSQMRSAASGAGERGYGSSEDLYDMPTDIKLPHVGEFVNVYQVHCPKITLTNATRNILQQYYLASRARRGFEYHMSTRAVKFIRDQAHPTKVFSHEPQGSDKRQRTTAAGAQAAAQAVRRMLTGEERPQPESSQRAGKQRSHSLSSTDPLFGWDKGVSERKAHLCLLLKPQIVLRSDNNARSVLVLAADHVVLRNHGILDTLNADDPVSGYVMQRNYADINSLQMFQPVAGSTADHLPLEVFVDFRCESRDFDRLVPQTNATLRYDKFNRLRLRNDVTTVAVSSRDGDMDMVDHLLHETDLIVVQVPQFSVSADASAFASMSDVVTNLLLFRDPVHKARMTQLETMLFSYNFTDLASAAKVVADLQSRIRQLIRIEGKIALDSADLDEAGQHDLLASKAHILTLSQELNLIFDAIKLAQDKTDDRNQEKKSALRLLASSSEISWRMIDENRELLAKMAVRGIDYSWLSRQDSSSSNKMDIRDLQAFHGSPNALWPELLAKHDDPPNHHMIRRGLFAEVQWSILAPVGGISIYDHFEIELHPIRLALETQLGNKLLDYLIPGRRSRREESGSEGVSTQETREEPVISSAVHSAPQLIVQPPLETPPSSSLAPPNRRARPVPSRSFSNLRSAAAASEYHAPGIPKSRSSTALIERRRSLESGHNKRHQSEDATPGKTEGDASEMRERSAQKTFVHVKIPSIHVLLSVMKGRSFLVRDARLRTHDLEWRNRTWSFDELISQFIPSDPTWRGWVKVAWQQHVFSVGGVVKELITKTQWGKMGKNPEESLDHTSRGSSSRAIRNSPEERLRVSARDSPERPSVPLNQLDQRTIPSREPSLAPSRRRSTSKPRKSGIFRRPGSRKTSIDSAEFIQDQSTGHHRKASDPK